MLLVLFLPIYHRQREGILVFAYAKVCTVFREKDENRCMFVASS